MTHAQHDPPDPRKPTITTIFTTKRPTISRLATARRLSNACLRVPPRPLVFSSHTRRRGGGMPDPPFALLLRIRLGGASPSGASNAPRVVRCSRSAHFSSCVIAGCIPRYCNALLAMHGELSSWNCAPSSGISPRRRSIVSSVRSDTRVWSRYSTWCSSSHCPCISSPTRSTAAVSLRRCTSHDCPWPCDLAARLH